MKAMSPRKSQKDKAMASQKDFCKAVEQVQAEQVQAEQAAAELEV